MAKKWQKYTFQKSHGTNVQKIAYINIKANETGFPSLLWLIMNYYYDETRKRKKPIKNEKKTFTKLFIVYSIATLQEIRLRINKGSIIKLCYAGRGEGDVRPSAMLLDYSM